MEIVFLRRGGVVVSVQDVARLAGVSPATVSRVLTRSEHPVKEETRRRVLDAAARLDFRPNLVARGLITSRTQTVGAIVHDIADPYFGEIVRGLEDGAHDRGYRLFACSSDRDPERELAYVEAMLAHRVDAVVFAGGGIDDSSYERRLSALLDEYTGRGGVVVSLAPRSYRAPSVTPDNAGGAAAMTEHLLELGHRRIAFVSGPPAIRTNRVRLRGYREALERAGVPFAADLVEPGDFTLTGGAKAAAALLGRRSDFTAVFAANDIMAFGVLQELIARGVGVPGQVSVAGFDDVQMAAYVHPPLTTIAVGTYAMGAEGIRLALALVHGERWPSRTLPVKLVIRESTAPPLRRT